MAVDLKHNRNTSLSSEFHQYHDVLSHNNNKMSYLRALLHSTTEVQKKEKEEDLIVELSHNMDHFMLQDNDKFHFSPNDSHNLELSWDLNTNKSKIAHCSYQSLIQEQIRAIELSKVKQEHVVALKQKLSRDGESEVDISTKQSKKKEKTEVGNGGRSYGPPRHAPMAEGGEGMQVIFLGGSDSKIGGTGVFFPRSGTTNVTLSESITKKQGKGCATVLIPSRVVQALQLHFDKMSSMSASKAGAFPPLHDVVVSIKDGIYSVQKQQSQEVPANIMQNEMILPQEWTY
ncbi:hypothetical protein Lal_00010229 [Lupinus albus]|uniref:Uncharacterized protein n=1 Tax=Lupinus albus TaxID=3870 RepID=A0A6A5LKB6_LUPAL|nr:hypothetical protein Lalb_Chr24g0397131 [Lupinus albus]KAF1859645.1 hypothetical protein Lal_00010229 [Lupinus albus]